MTDQIDRTEYVLLDGTGAERARGTAVEIGDALLSHDGWTCGCMWADENEVPDRNGAREWRAYRYLDNQVHQLRWMRVKARTMAEALDKMALAAFEAGGNGRDHYLSVMSADEFDAAEEGDEA